MAYASMRILVLDHDTEEVARIVASLRNDGHVVTVSGDADAALAIAKQDDPGAVLLALAVLGANASDMVRALRGEVLRPHASIIAIGGSTAELAQVGSVGADLVLETPLDAEHVGSLIQYITRLRRHGLRAR